MYTVKVAAIAASIFAVLAASNAQAREMPNNGSHGSAVAGQKSKAHQNHQVRARMPHADYHDAFAHARSELPTTQSTNPLFDSIHGQPAR